MLANNESHVRCVGLKSRVGKRVRRRGAGFVCLFIMVTGLSFGCMGLGRVQMTGVDRQHRFEREISAGADAPVRWIATLVMTTEPFCSDTESSQARVFTLQPLLHGACLG
jgi:hypothetical protein